MKDGKRVEGHQHVYRSGTETICLSPFCSSKDAKKDAFMLLTFIAFPILASFHWPKNSMTFLSTPFF